MLIDEKTTGPISFFFFVKRSVSNSETIRKKYRWKKAQAKLVKCAKNKYWVPMTPPGVNDIIRLDHCRYRVGNQLVLYISDHQGSDRVKLEHLCFIKHVYQSTIVEMYTQSAQERRPDEGNRSSSTSIWSWRRRRVLIRLTSARRREKHVGLTCGPTFCLRSQCHLRPFPDLCPAAFNVTPTKKWRWPDSQYSSSTYCRPFARLHWTSHRRRNDVDPTFSWPAQDPLRPIIYTYATSFRQRNDVGPTSVGPYVLNTCLKSFLATVHKW